MDGGEVDVGHFVEKCFELEEKYYFLEAKKGKLSPQGRLCRKRKEKVKSSYPIIDWHKPAVVSYTPDDMIGEFIPKPPTPRASSKPKTNTSDNPSTSNPSTSTTSHNDTFNETHYTRQLHQNTSGSSHASGLTIAQLLDMSNRELTPEDYEMLLLLDNTVAKKTCLKDQIAELRETHFSPGGDSSSCAVCMFEFEEGERVKHIRCGHFFHSDCIEPWLTQHSTQCPLCKAEVF
uniref:RING-type domain-containing protein n=1 Tax=Arcella intermedia TaxID=1963864 RepID=A0A6B2LGD4_9EUKA